MTAELTAIIARYGYMGTFVVVLLASSGVPLPAGELLIAAAIFAAHTHRLDPVLLVLVSAAGAVMGGASGYGIGTTAGAAGLRRFGGYVGFGPARVRLGQYLFLKYGGKIVFFVRFVALVGPFGGVLAGTNRMPWPRFMMFNALGGVCWAAAFGLGGYAFGALLEAVGRPLGIAAGVIVVVVVGGLFLWLHRHEKTLQAEADALLGTEA
jgi:membrane protein DedA with SNARE-associated domain